jgi:hypothetical protein
MATLLVDVGYRLTAFPAFISPIADTTARTPETSNRHLDGRSHHRRKPATVDLVDEPQVAACG